MYRVLVSLFSMQIFQGILFIGVIMGSKPFVFIGCIGLIASALVFSYNIVDIN